MTGYQVMAALRADPTTHTPVIVITADATPATRVQILSSGAFAYLTKPCQVTDLLAITSSALRHGNAHAAAARPPPVS
jgi:CheY-like chemotaxis protein